MGFRRARDATCGHFRRGDRRGRAHHAEHRCGGDLAGATYLTDAEDILGALSGRYLDTSPSGEAVLTDGYTGTANGTNTALIYGDYYFTEALLRLQNVLDGEPDWVLYSPAATSVVPEPATWTMMLLGFAGLGFAGYRRRPRSSRA